MNFYIPLTREAAEGAGNCGFKMGLWTTDQNEMAEATWRDVSSNFCNTTVVDAGEVSGEQDSRKLCAYMLTPPATAGDSTGLEGPLI